ncbi:MAG: hypothetical protein MUE88_05555, partial [Flavobacteriales bacterium]|nr:hypothetical protein [Flavobacteriales bacterium]
FEGAPGVRSYPHLVQGEGFFLAMLRKPGTWTALTPDVPSPSPRAPWADWLCPTEEDVHATELDGVVHVVDAGWRSLMRKVDAVLRVVSPGLSARATYFTPCPRWP